MELTTHILTESDCYKARRTIRPKGVMVHSTGVAQPDPSGFLRRWNAPGVNACVHAFVYTGGVIQTLPWNHRGWHAGTGTSGKSANDTHISFEILEPAGHTYRGGTMIGYDVQKNTPYFRTVYQTAVELTADLCKRYSLDPLADGVVLCHSEGYRRGIASGHADVEHWFPKHNKSMDDFRRDVASAMKGEFDLTEAQVRAMIREELAPITAAIQALTPTVYPTFDDLPPWARPGIRLLMDRGIVQGDEQGNLNLDNSTLRALVALSRTL